MELVLAQRDAVGPTGNFVGAALCIAVSIFFVVAAARPRWRRNISWGRRFSGGKGHPMSPVGLLAWAIASAAWAVLMFAEAIKFAPILSGRGWILSGAFALIMAAALGDVVYFRLRRKAE
jgi:hypothetical protein